MKNLSTLIVLVFFSTFAYAQKGNMPKAGLGINLAPIAGGTPELQFEYFFNRYAGITGSVGATLFPRRGVSLVDDGVNLKSLKGLYYKGGVKFRLPLKSKRFIPWFNFQYIYSRYEEKGTKYILLSNKDSSLHIRGVVHGLAVSPGFDFRLTNRIDARLGCQFGYFKRDQHFGKEARTYQPGFGSIWLAVYEQFVVGFNYRLGVIKKEKQ